MLICGWPAQLWSGLSETRSLTQWQDTARGCGCYQRTRGCSWNAYQLTVTPSKAGYRPARHCQNGMTSAPANVYKCWHFARDSWRNRESRAALFTVIHCITAIKPTNTNIPG